MEMFMKNTQLALHAINTGDHAFELLQADSVENAYEKACCGSLDAAYEKCKK